MISGKFVVQKGDVTKVKPVSKDTFQCNECGKWFDLPHSLEGHKQSHLNKDKFSCTKCGKTFLYKLVLRKHKTKHVEPVKCDKCDGSSSAEDCYKAVMSILKVGYMEMGTASVYDNEKEVRDMCKS